MKKMKGVVPEEMSFWRVVLEREGEEKRKEKKKKGGFDENFALGAAV